MILIQNRESDYEMLKDVIQKENGLGEQEINVFVDKLKNVYKKFIFDPKTGEIVCAVDLLDNLLLSSKVKINEE